MRQFLDRMNEKLDTWANTRVVRGVNITSHVVWNLILIFFVLIFMLVFFVGAAGAGYFVSLVEDESVQESEEMLDEVYNYDEISEVYFANDEYLGELPADLERRVVTLDEVSEHLKQAIIATEDEYFYEHEGIVPKAIFRATYQEVANAGNQTGGSTLTQQLVKNQLLSPEVSFERKAQEIMLAMRLENFMEKDEILEAYLNVVPFGRNASGRNIAGVQSAAEGIFGVDASDLNIAQSAFIAGLPQSPFGYSPFEANGAVKENFDAGLNRMQTVLNRMERSGYIDEDEHEEALDYDIRGDLTEAAPNPFDEYPYVAYETASQASSILMQKRLEEDDVDLDSLEGEERQETIDTYRQEAQAELRQQGYVVHTTIDKDIYDAMQEAVAGDQWFGPTDEHGDPEQVGAALIDNQTGALLSFVGGRDHEIEAQNMATQGGRPVGSTVKPYLSYAPALERGEIHPGQIVPDVPSTYSEGEEVSNFDNQHSGFLPVRESIEQSRNIPAVRSLQLLDEGADYEASNLVQNEEVYEGLDNLGIPREEVWEPYALGSLELSVVDNTNAFQALANQGQYQEAYMIESIETRDGEVIYEHEPESREAFSEETAYMMTDMLRGVLTNGTASGLPNMMNTGGDWAGKTGTTGEFRDSWFVGYNPEVTLGTWIGYPQNTQISRNVNGMDYSPRTQQIWANLLNAANDANVEAIAAESSFEQPETVVTQSICGISGLLPSSRCQEAGFVETDLMNQAFIPTEVDNSLDNIEYVTINDQPYRAYSSTPGEFTQSGVGIDEQYFDIDDVDEYLPGNLTDNVVPDREAPTNDWTPSEVSGVSINGGNVTWNQHPDNDIIGYRIYRAVSEGSSFAAVDTVIGNTETSYSGSPGYAYYVTAVDSQGRESNSSGTAEPGQWADPSAPEEEDEEDETIEEPSEPPVDDSPENEDGEEAPPEGNGPDNGDGTEPEEPEEPETPNNGDDNGNGDDNSNDEEPEPEEDNGNEEEDSDEDEGDEG
ncbi:transglycosylase domain-containing protein [Salsuginibacillus kocurii]|uniref:transglycosylase domain-containing protein n=1 Tax=Salsuginibacillus kocurii TaxID=427078 RepID=UPI00036A7C0F|nr:transglycosylase domain-containing protein [Salsuginibacillus kocurii]